jgi:hypothetical protein
VLERGRRIEDGPHAALIAAGGRYARLHAIQSGQPQPQPGPQPGPAVQPAPRPAEAAL